MSATPDEIEPYSLQISQHARIRAATRLGVVKARERIRSLLDRAEPVDADYVRGAKAYQAGSVTIVVEGDIVKTLFEKEVADGA